MNYLNELPFDLQEYIYQILHRKYMMDDLLDDIDDFEV